MQWVDHSLPCGCSATHQQPLLCQLSLAEAVLVAQHHCRAGALLPSWCSQSQQGTWLCRLCPVVLGGTLLAGSAPAVFKAPHVGRAVGQLILQAGSGGVLLLLASPVS